MYMSVHYSPPLFKGKVPAIIVLVMQNKIWMKKQYFMIIKTTQKGTLSHASTLQLEGVMEALVQSSVFAARIPC